MRKILLSLLLCVASQAFGVDRYIDPDAVGTPVDGTTWGQAYRSMDQWEAAEQAVLGETMTVNLRASSGTPDVNTCVITGWTTYVDKYINLIGDGTYKMQITNSGVTPALYIGESFVRMSGLWIEQAVTNGNVSMLKFNYQDASNDVRIDSCVFKGPGEDGDIIYGVNLEDDAGDDTILRMSNSLIYDVGTGNLDMALRCQEFDTLYLYNCTIIGGQYGIYDANAQEVPGNIIMKNCVINGSTTCATIVDAVTTFSTDNLFSDASGFGANVTANTTLTFTGATYHLDSTDTEAIDVGVDLTGDPNIAVTDDYDGDARPQGSDYDLGYDEYVPAGGAETNYRAFRRRMN